MILPSDPLVVPQRGFRRIQPDLIGPGIGFIDLGIGLSYKKPLSFRQIEIS